MNVVITVFFKMYGIFFFTRYEETWVSLHKRAKECAKTGEVSSHMFSWLICGAITMVTKPCGLSDGGWGDCDAVCTLGEETRSSAGAAGTTAADPCFPLGPGVYHLTYWWDFHKQSSHIRILINDKSELFIIFMILLEKEVINITLVLNVKSFSLT